MTSMKKKKEALIGDRADWNRLQETPIIGWSVSDVGLWLQYMDLGQYRKKFIENQIGGTELTELDPEDLVALGVTSLGHRKRVLKEIEALCTPVEMGGQLDDGNGSDTDTLSERSGSSRGSHRSGASSHRSSASTSSSQQEGPEYLAVKVYYKKKIAVVSIKQDCSLSKLERKIRKEFNRSRLELSYEDSDGDKIPLKKDKDLLTAIRTLPHPIRIRATRKKSSSKASTQISAGECQMMEGMVDAIVCIDLYGNILLFNKKAEEMFGYHKEEVMGQNVKVLMPPAYAVNHDLHLRKFRHRSGGSKRSKKSGSSSSSSSSSSASGGGAVIGTTRNVLAQHKDGRQFFVQLSLSSVKDKHLVTGTLREVSGSSSSFSSSSSSSSASSDQLPGNLETLMHQLSISDDFRNIAALTDAALACDLVGNILMINRAGMEMWGYLKETETSLEDEKRALQSLVGQNVSILMPSPHRENHTHYMMNYQRTKVSRVIGKTRQVIIEKMDGMIVPVYLGVSEQIRKSNGDKYFIGILTLREPNREEARAAAPTGLAGTGVGGPGQAKPKALTFLQEQRSRVHGIQTPAVIINAQGLVQAFNDAASALLGYDLSDVLGRNVNILMPPTEAALHDNYIQNYLRTNVPRVIGKERIVVAKKSSGEVLEVRLTVTEAKSADQRLFIGMFHSV